MQGSFIIEELTDLVEEAVLTEFDRITERGGVLGSMETMYQRGKIQEESLIYSGFSIVNQPSQSPASICEYKEVQVKNRETINVHFIR